MSTVVSEPVKTGPSVADVLDKAADWALSEYDWVQGRLFLDERGDECLYPQPGVTAVCMFGASRMAAAYLGFADPVVDEAEAAIEEVCDHNGVGWNDAPGRTKAEVVAKLREAAALARKWESEA